MLNLLIDPNLVIQRALYPEFQWNLKFLGRGKHVYAGERRTGNGNVEDYTLPLLRYRVKAHNEHSNAEFEFSTIQWLAPPSLKLLFNFPLRDIAEELPGRGVILARAEIKNLNGIERATAEVLFSAQHEFGSYEKPFDGMRTHLGPLREIAEGLFFMESENLVFDTNAQEYAVRTNCYSIRGAKISKALRERITRAFPRN